MLVQSNVIIIGKVKFWGQEKRHCGLDLINVASIKYLGLFINWKGRLPILPRSFIHGNDAPLTFDRAASATCTPSSDFVTTRWQQKFNIPFYQFDIDYQQNWKVQEIFEHRRCKKLGILIKMPCNVYSNCLTSYSV